MQMPLPLGSRLDEAVARTRPRVNLGFAQCRASVRTPSVTAPSSNDRLQALAEQSAQDDQPNGLARRNRLGSWSMAAGVGSEVCANSDARPLQACGVGLPSVSVTATARCRSQSGRYSRPAFRLHDQHAAKVLLKTGQQVCGCEGSVGSWRGVACRATRRCRRLRTQRVMFPVGSPHPEPEPAGRNLVRKDWYRILFRLSLGSAEREFHRQPVRVSIRAWPVNIDFVSRHRPLRCRASGSVVLAWGAWLQYVSRNSTDG